MEQRKELDRFLTAKRERKQEKINKREWRARYLRIMREQEGDKNFGKTSKIISMLAKNYHGKSYKHRDTLRLIIPSTFSIIEKPEEVVAVIGQFAKSIREQRPGKLILDQRNLTIYDLAANGLLDVVAVELVKETKKSRRKTKWQGNFPNDENVKRFIKALGIIKHLGLEDRYPVNDAVPAYRVFDRRNRHYYAAMRPEEADFKSKAVTEFANHINSCLGDHGRKLTPEALSKLCDYTGEIIDNAEEHAGMFDWTIQGYLDNNCEVPFCEIAIFNFGDTIAETLNSLPRESYTWKQIHPYLQQHYKKRLFGPNWSELDLLTVIALQGHVSCKNKSATDTRGNGSIDLIEFFQMVYKECTASDGKVDRARMAILSGGTYILFDGSHQLVELENGVKTVTFNAENSLDVLPDPKYVRGLKGVHFPGTIISIRFPLREGSIVNKGELNASEQ